MVDQSRHSSDIWNLGFRILCVLHHWCPCLMSWRDVKTSWEVTAWHHDVMWRHGLTSWHHVTAWDTAIFMVCVFCIIDVHAWCHGLTSRRHVKSRRDTMTSHDVTAWHYDVTTWDTAIFMVCLSHVWHQTKTSMMQKTQNSKSYFKLEILELKISNPKSQISPMVHHTNYMQIICKWYAN